MSAANPTADFGEDNAVFASAPCVGGAFPLGGGPTDGKGITRFSPLSDWSHEHILAFIHYHQLPLPPIYGWANGYL